MRIVETTDPNFRVLSPVRILYGEGVLQLHEGDAVRLANQAGHLCVETSIDGTPVRIRVEDKASILRLLKSVAHESEFAQVRLPLDKALLDEDIPTEQLALMLREAQRTGKDIEKITIERHAHKLSVEDRVRRVLDTAVTESENAEEYVAESVVR